MNNAEAQVNLLVKMTLSAWDSQNNYLKKHIHSLTDAQLAAEVAPGRNTGIYLVGHLIAVSDALFPLLGFGDKLYPEMEEIFIESPDKSGHDFPSVAELKLRLDAVNQRLAAFFSAQTNEDWLSRHMAVSPEDFSTQPHRNKLNVIISRTNHLATHLGQLLLIKN